jgi:hypothetical protein
MKMRYTYTHKRTNFVLNHLRLYVQFGAAAHLDAVDTLGSINTLGSLGTLITSVTHRAARTTGTCAVHEDKWVRLVCESCDLRVGENAVSVVCKI